MPPESASPPEQNVVPSSFVPQSPPLPLSSEESNTPPASSSQHKNSKNYLGQLLLGFCFLIVGVAIGWILKDKVGTQVSSPATMDNKKPLLIGAIVPLTGDSASYGVALQQAGFLAQREINANGGISGRQIEILWENGRCEGEDAELAAVKLLEEKKVEMLMGGVCSSEFLKSAPIAQSHKILSFSPSATSTQISSLGKYVFRTAPSDALAGKVAAQYATNKWNAKTAAIVAENKVYPLGIRDVFSAEFVRLGGSVQANEVFESGATDFSEYANKVKAANVDVVYILPQSSTPGVLLVKALKEVGVTAKLLTAEVLLIRDAVAESGDILEGVTGIEVLVDETRPQTQRFLDMYKKEYNLDPTYPGFMSGMYDLIYLYKEAYEKGGPDVDKMDEYLHTLKDWPGAVGTINFDAHGDPTLAYSIRLLTGGKAEQVDIFTPTID